jgi:hypothetical protein
MLSIDDIRYLDIEPMLEPIKIYINFRPVSELTIPLASDPIIETTDINHPLTFWFNKNAGLSLPYVAIPWYGPYPDIVDYDGVALMFEL